MLRRKARVEIKGMGQWIIDSKAKMGGGLCEESYNLIYAGCPKKLFSDCVAFVKELYIELFWFLHSCLGRDLNND